MSEREHPRMPYAVQVEFRTPSSFLVAYSVNLSRGGLFLETDADIPTGALMTLDFSVPGSGTTSLNGVVAWRRGNDNEGPHGIGVEFQDVAPQLGALIDKLVSTFRGVQILIVSGDRQDRTTLARSIKSIISTAEITQAADANVASTVLTHEIDVAIIDADHDLEGGIAIIRKAKAQNPPVPTIALASKTDSREQMVAAGADELLANPPPFAELQVVLLRALGKPIAIRHLQQSGAVDVDIG
ncbi:MAG TPA: TIGR02266 family protein [Kofleriaceae bacterium]